MLRSRRFDLGISAVFLASIAAYILLPHGELIQQLASVPLVGSLVVALVQVLRDQARHERETTLQEYQNRFALGASSHMADVAFDKHVEPPRKSRRLFDTSGQLTEAYCRVS